MNCNPFMIPIKSDGFQNDHFDTVGMTNYVKNVLL